MTGPAAAALLLLAGGAQPAPVPVPELLHTYHGVIHCHSKLSPDSKGTFEEIAGAAKRAGVDFVIMTDHPGPGVPENQPQGFFGGTLFIPGIELNHLLALGVTRPVTDGAAADVARQVAEQGGLTFVAHPESFDEWDAPGLAGTEVYNVHADLSDEYLPWAVPKALFTAGKDPVNVLASTLDFPGPAYRRWDEQSLKRPFTGIAADDAHHNFGKLDPYEVPFRFVNTYVLAPSLDAASILEALRLGRAYVAFRDLGDPDGFSFTAAGDTLVANAPQPAEFRLFKDGVEVSRAKDARALNVQADGPGLYRVEVFRKAGGRMRPWILANPIRIAAPSTERETR